MNWLQKIALSLLFKDIPQYMLKSLNEIVGGSWEISNLDRSQEGTGVSWRSDFTGLSLIMIFKGILDNGHSCIVSTVARGKHNPSSFDFRMDARIDDRIGGNNIEFTSDVEIDDGSGTWQVIADDVQLDGPIEIAEMVRDNINWSSQVS